MTAGETAQFNMNTDTLRTDAHRRLDRALVVCLAKSAEAGATIADRIDALERELVDAKDEVARLRRRDSFDLQGINRVVADQTAQLRKNNEALMAALKLVCEQDDRTGLSRMIRETDSDARPDSDEWYLGAIDHARHVLFELK